MKISAQTQKILAKFGETELNDRTLPLVVQWLRENGGEKQADNLQAMMEARNARAAARNRVAAQSTERIAACVRLLQRAPMHSVARAPSAVELLGFMFRTAGKSLEWVEVVEALRIHVCTLRELAYADERERSTLPRADPLPVRPRAKSRKKPEPRNVGAAFAIQSARDERRGQAMMTTLRRPANA